MAGGSAKGGGGHAEGVAGVRLYVWIYILLLAFTGLSVAVSQLLMDVFGHTPVTVAILAFSTIKATFILAYYMHLKYERIWIRMWLYLPLAIFVLVLIGVGPDIYLVLRDLWTHILTFAGVSGGVHH